jgi:hypothetical protein
MEDLKLALDASPKKKWKLMVKANPTWVTYLKTRYPFSTCLNEQIYLFLNHMDTPPMCPVIGCGNHVNWINTNHYGATCSYSCAQQMRKQMGTLPDIQMRIQQTMLDRYGVDNANKSSTVITKRNQTLMNKYGALVSPRTRESAQARAADMYQKSKNTIRNKYGVDHVSQIPGVQAKKTQTLQNKYGVHHPSQIPHVKQQRLQQRVTKYQDLSESAATILEWMDPNTELQSKYENPNPRIRFTCDACGLEDVLAMETFRWRAQTTGTPCIKCSGINKGSLQEGQIKSYVKSLGVPFISNDRQQLHPNELDIYVPSHNLAIEYCGLYWHSELHGSDKHRHLDKMLACAEKDIRLVTIFEDEWIHKPHIVRARIKNMLQLNSSRIGARMFTCKQVDAKTANAFCADHHVQGVGKTVHAYGLYMHDELSAVMTFSKLSVAKGSKAQDQVWELNRFCVKPDVTISGGANKLFHAFLKDCDPRQVISYSDRRWNTGHVYAQLGFDRAHDTPPNYWYIDFKSMARIHRYSLRKTAQDDPNLTEWENRKLQGWNRIWDCGSTKWIWNKKAE